MTKEDVRSVNIISPSQKIKVTNPRFYRRNNLKLFSTDNKLFWCCICGCWKPINEYLTDVWKENERVLYLSLMISEIKHFHMRANIKKILREHPDLNEKINRKAMNMIIDNLKTWDFLKRNGIGPDHFDKLEECDRATKEKLLKRVGLVWK